MKQVTDMVNVYKIRDTEDDKYSEYIMTSVDCKKLIDSAVEHWIDCPDDEYYNAENVFDMIEHFLNNNGIVYKWLKFDNTNTIDY